MKICSKCGLEKPLECFYKSKTGKLGVEAQCKECRKAQMAKRMTDPEARARRLETKRKYAAENKAKCYAASKAWYERNRDRRLQKGQEWRKNNAEDARRIGRAASQRRRALERNALVEGFAEPLAEVLVQFYGKACLFPGCTATVAEPDHIQALVRGGKHTYYNTQPLCRSHNGSKGDRHSTDYREGHNKYGILMDRTIT